MPVVPESLAHSLADRYRIERELGRGGMAIVYLAEDLKHHRQVAIKVLSPEIAAAIGPERFLREIEVAARLTHPHILPLHDSGAADGRLYYVTPYVPGESLRARLDRERQLSVEDALRLAREIASALGHAHQQGVIHRDVKPENILLADGMALVADFGIAHVASRAGGTALTTAGTAIGTPAYMSPEQVLGHTDVDGRADLYSLACVVYEMLAGVPPFIGPPESLLHQHLSTEPRSVTEVRPGVPAGVATAIAKALSKLAADRYATTARFVEALDAGVATPSPRATAVVGSPNNLPRERTRFIGRERELEEGAALLREARLLTLIGIGGSGKTRLALKLAETVQASFPDGVWFVDLGPLSEGGHVAGAVAAVLGVREETEKSVEAVLSEHVAGRRLLLVLDNCEHLLAASADLADSLLRAGRDVSLLATSREPLGVDGERVAPVRSLAVPSAEAARNPRLVEQSDAVRLFLDRAQLAVPDFRLDDDNAAAIVEICRRLDGIPLAIELAAARVKILSPEQIRARLDDRFRLLTGGTRTGLARHQTLRATIQWSFGQLAPDEQRLLRRLAVFAGGWTLASATQVAAEDGDEFAVMDLLTRLVDRSLVRVDREPKHEPRYSLLETVRQYALEGLIETGEAEMLRQRHLTEFLRLAERAYAERLEHEESWAAILEGEHDNLRAALDVARASDAELYLELTGALAWFWYVRSHLAEGRAHVTAALGASDSSTPRAALARALWGGAQLAAWQGASTDAIAWMEEAIETWREMGDHAEVANALDILAWAQLLSGQEEASLATFLEERRLQEERGDPVLIHRAIVGVAQVLVALHRVGEARPLAEQIVAFAEQRGDRRTEHFGFHFLADCALIGNDPAAALRLYRRSLALAQAIKDRVEASFEVQGVAMSLAGLGHAERALRLSGAVEAERERLGTRFELRFWDGLLAHYLGRAREALGAEEAEKAWAAGRSLPFEEAVTGALEEEA